MPTILKLKKPAATLTGLFSAYTPQGNVMAIVARHNAVTFHDEDGQIIPGLFNQLKKLTRPPFVLSQEVPAQFLDDLQKSVPDYLLTNGQSSMLHPKLAASRAVFEQVIWDQLARTYGPGVIVDVGACARRHARRGRAVHMLMPNLLPGDNGRILEAIGLVGMNPQLLSMCNHRITECVCVRGRPAMSIHSLYYLHPTDIVNFMVDTACPTMIALHHRFDIAGSFAGEAVYKLTDFKTAPGLVTMDVAGNGVPYTHSAMSWMDKAYHTAETQQGLRHLVWDSEQIGPKELGLYKTKFTLAVNPPVRLPRNPHDLLELLAEQRDSVTITGTKDQQFIATLAEAIGDNRTLKQRFSSMWNSTFGRFLPKVEPSEYEVLAGPLGFWVRDVGAPGPHMVYVSRMIVENTTFRLAGGTITQAAVESAMNSARLLLKNNINLPIDVASEMLLPSVRLALHRAALLNKRHFTALKPLAPLIEKANQAAATWMDVAPEPRWVVAGAAMATLAAIWFMSPVRPTLRWPGLTRILMTATKQHVEHQMDRAVATTMVAAALYGVAKTQALTPPARRFLPWFALCAKEVVPPPIGKHWKTGKPLHSIRTEFRGDCQLQFGNVGVFKVRCRQPSVAASCHHNINLGLRVRLMALDYNPIAGFNDLTEAAMKLARKGILAPVPFPQWLGRFKPDRRQILAKAAEEERTEQKPACYSTRQIFIKREGYPKVGLVSYGPTSFFQRMWRFLGYEQVVENELKPRIISGPMPEYLVKTGPITLAISNWLKIVWDGVTTKVIYSSGRTPDQLGKVFKAIIELLGGEANIQFIEADAKNFDGCIRPEHYAYELRVYKLMGVAMKKLRLLAIQALKKKVVWIDRAKGSLGSLVAAMIWACRNSGDGNTSCGNSIICERLAEIFIGNIFKHGFLFVLGDDSLFIYPANIAAPRNEDIIARAKAAGFPLEVVQGRGNQGTFCSGAFIPCQAHDGPTYVWAPLPGRMLAKFGWCTHNYENEANPDQKYFEWFVGVCKGLHRDFNFVPVMRVIVGRVVAEHWHAGIEVVYHEHRPHTTGWYESNQDTIEWFCTRYGLEPAQVEDCENYLSRADLFNGDVQHPVIQALCDKDTPLDVTGPKASKSKFLSYIRDLVNPAAFAHQILKISPIRRRIWHWVASAIHGTTPAVAELIDEIAQFKVVFTPPFMKHEVTTYVFHSLWRQTIINLTGTKLSTGSALADFVIDVVVFTPLVEETIKEMASWLGLKYAGAAFGFFEGYPFLKLSGFTKGGVSLLLWKMGFHSWLGPEHKSYWKRLATHMMWNIMSMGVMFGVQTMFAVNQHGVAQ